MKKVILALAALVVVVGVNVGGASPATVPARTALLVHPLAKYAPLVREQFGPRSIQCTAYWVSGPCSNPQHSWVSSDVGNVYSSSFARREWQVVWVYDSCLPGWAKWRFSYWKQGGAFMEGSVRESAWGACSFSANVSSNGVYVKAACRIIVTNGTPLSKDIACGSQWY
jgi:hypothetical protein